MITPAPCHLPADHQRRYLHHWQRSHSQYHHHKPPASGSRTGAATDIIFGLALGYKSCIIPTIVIAVAIYASSSLAGMFGIACSALGMLSTLATGEEAVGG